MVAQLIINTTGKVIEEPTIKEFKESLHGGLLRPDDHGYDEARKVWNGMFDRHPALIVRCAGVADVVRAVDFARENELLVALRGGGHSIPGYSVCDDGIVIDLSCMKGIRLDPKARTARAQAGLTWHDFDCETQAFGLATTGGLVSTTGIAGLTLGGGIGWLMGKYGLACDNLISADVVTADCRFITASTTENEDLFWGLRGGGGNFGIVTSFEYQLHPVGPLIAGMAVHPIAKAREVLQFYREFTATAPDELTAYAGLFVDPDGNPVVAIILCYAGPLEEGEASVRPVKEFGVPIVDQIGPMTYTDVQTQLDACPSSEWGFLQYWKSDFLKELSDEAIETVIAYFSTRPSPRSVAFIEHMHGAYTRMGGEGTAFGQRDASYNFIASSTWSDRAESDKQIQWVRDFWAAMQPFSTGGVYVNYLGTEGQERVRAAYGTAKYERLVALKNKYDPTNFFRLNQNINPTATPVKTYHCSVVKSS